MMRTKYTEQTPLSFQGEGLYLAEGVLTQLQIARTTVDLLGKIERNLHAKSIVSGTAAVLGGMYGVVANSAAIALYDGEDTFNFAGMLNDQVICGSFQHADKIRDGDQVRVVVSKRGEVLFTHAIMNARTQEFYMPLNVFSSSDGLLRHCMRVAMWTTVFGWIVFFGLAVMTGTFSDVDINYQKKVIFAVIMFVTPPLIMFPFEYWTYHSMKGDSEEASYGGAIFEIFGFREPNKIDLMGDSTLSDGAHNGWYAAWRGDKLLQKNGA
jgi:hypothetical protein